MRVTNKKKNSWKNILLVKKVLSLFSGGFVGVWCLDGTEFDAVECGV